jgi:hypothetical protein
MFLGRPPANALHGSADVQFPAPFDCAEVAVVSMLLWVDH